jgi:hypothetical protein
MASIGKEKGKGKGTLKRILFMLGGKRRTIRLGDVSMKKARTFKSNLEDLIACRITGSAIDADTARWLKDLPDAMRDRLVALGLAQPRIEPAEERDECEENAIGPRLGEFLEEYLRGRDELKPNSILVYGHSRRNLIEFFGADTPLASITAYDADRWRRHLKRQGLS